jgi:tetratricopeptide (TPR) repeat protein
VSEEQIKKLLQEADVTARRPVFNPVAAGRIRQRIHRRRVMRSAGLTAAAAVVVVAATLWIVCMQRQKPQPEQQRIVSLEMQVRELQVQTNATLKLVQEVLEKDRQDRHLASLEAELSSIPEPMMEIERQVDKTAFLLVYQADKLYKELNQTESAVAAYKEVIQLFPKNRWADVARERLSQIEKRQINKSDKQGETRCKPGTA